jgi:hypothetical protein
LELLTWLTMMRAGPVASHGLPCTRPPSWVDAVVRLLFRIAPAALTSNWLYWLMLTPAALGVVMFTSGTPLGATSTWGFWPAAAKGLGTICACASVVPPAREITANADQPMANTADRHPAAALASVAALLPLPVLVAVSATTMRRPRAALKMTRWSP